MKKVKKIKKIPKYSVGTDSIKTITDQIKTKANESGNAALSAPLKQPDALTKHNAQQMSNALNKNYGAQSMPSFNGISALNTGAGVAATASQPIATALGIELGLAALIASGLGKAVGLVNPVAGLAIEAAAPFLGGAGHNDYNKITTTNDATTATTKKSGAIGLLFGNNTDDLYRKASTYQNSLMAAEQTANKQLEWANDPRNQGMVSTLKEGGVIIGDPSKGLTRAQVDSREVITDKNGNDAVRLPYAEGTDSIPALIQPTYKVFSADRGYADIAEKIIKGTEEGSRLRQIETNNLAIILEMTKIKKPTNSKILHASDGDIVPYSYDKNLSNFKYWDVKNNDYTKDYLDWVNTITDQDVKDIYSGKYGNMNAYLGKNKNYIPTVELARMLMTDKKYGDWHKIAEAVKTQMDSRVAPVRLSKAALDKATPTYNDSPWYTEDGQMRWNLSKFGNKNIIKSDPYKKPFDWNGLMNTIADYAPLVAAYANKPKWDVESASTWIPEYVPVAVDKSNQIRAIKDVMNTSKYNIRNISPNTGAYMAYASNAASQAAKQYADIYTDKTNEEFARIAHNAGIHNQWAPQIAAAIDQAKANTQANKAAAYAQRDVNIKDTMSYLRDQQMLPFLIQYLSSGAYDKSIKKLS